MYTKTDETIPNVRSAFNAVLGTMPDLRDAEALFAAGVTVRLDTGELVFVSCTLQDNPETPDVEFGYVAIAGSSEGVLTMPSGQPVGVAFMHSAEPAIVQEFGADAIRRDCMLTVLGEPVLLANAPIDVRGRSIRERLAAREAIMAPTGDVL